MVVRVLRLPDLAGGRPYLGRCRGAVGPSVPSALVPSVVAASVRRVSPSPVPAGPPRWRGRSLTTVDLTVRRSLVTRLATCRRDTHGGGSERREPCGTGTGSLPPYGPRRRRSTVPGSRTGCGCRERAPSLPETPWPCSTRGSCRGRMAPGFGWRGRFYRPQAERLPNFYRVSNSAVAVCNRVGNPPERD